MVARRGVASVHRVWTVSVVVWTVSDSRSVDYLFPTRRPVRKSVWFHINDACCTNQLHNTDARLASNIAMSTKEA